jgi:hypothetical protein
VNEGFGYGGFVVVMEVRDEDWRLLWWRKSCYGGGDWLGMRKWLVRVVMEVVENWLWWWKTVT